MAKPIKVYWTCTWEPTEKVLGEGEFPRETKSLHESGKRTGNTEAPRSWRQNKILEKQLRVSTYWTRTRKFTTRSRKSTRTDDPRWPHRSWDNEIRGKNNKIVRRVTPTTNLSRTCETYFYKLRCSFSQWGSKRNMEIVVETIPSCAVADVSRNKSRRKWYWTRPVDKRKMQTVRYYDTYLLQSVFSTVPIL